MRKWIDMNVPIFSTYIHPKADAAVMEVLNSTFISEGNVVREFELQLSEQLGLLNPVTVNSGTSALHLALVLAGVSEGDEVIIPAQTFVATGLVVLQQKAVPVFADIDYLTGNISPESFKSKITGKTKAVIPVHWGGYPCEMDAISQIAKLNNIVVIEDAAHALGALFNGRKVGGISDFTCFSFQAIKHLTTGDGGAIACLHSEDAREALIRRWFGIDRLNSRSSSLGERQYDIQSVGFKYHLNDYAAALGLANLEGFIQRLGRRIEFAKMYTESLSNISGIELFRYTANNQSAYWLYGFHVERRDEFIASLKAKGIAASVVHQRIDRNSVFGGLRNDLPNQEKFDSTQIHIPIHDHLNVEKIRYIIECIKNGW
jgi:perosamine synthetase